MCYPVWRLIRNNGANSLMFERKKFKQKRRILSPMPPQDVLDDLAERVRYRGNPSHKRNPGYFDLTPPAQPRADKTLCDLASIFEKAVAQRWLQEGVRQGMISSTSQDDYPKHIWAVTDENVVLEANYNNEGPGNYHGYPLFEPDPFRQIVLNRWTRS